MNLLLSYKEMELNDMDKHPRMKEAIENAKVAAVSNRGMYPYTRATNVFKADGTPLEEREETTDEKGE